MENTRKNILYLPKWYPHKDNAYHGIFVRRHAVSASKYHNIFVVFAKSTQQKEWVNKEVSNEDGIETLRYYYKKRITGISPIDSIIKLFLYFLCCNRAVSEFRSKGIEFDLLHIHVLGRTGVFALFSKLNFVITEHWSGYFPERNEYKGWFRKWMDRMVVRNSKYILTVSDALINAMIGHNLKGNYKVVHNVVVDYFFNNSLESVKENQFLVVADQDNAVKNITGILNAFKKFSESNLNSKMIVIGDGVDVDLITSHSNKLELGQSVVFMGAQDKDVVASELRKSIGLILFSNFENSPCVIGESYACGTPVIATNVGGVSELLSEKRGVLIAPKNEGQLCEAMMTLNSKIYDSNELRDFASENLSSKIIGNQLNQVYNSI